MKNLQQSIDRARATLVAAVALLALASCGGGDGVVGSGGTGVALGRAVGTVNGFGSVIVDGVSYDNRLAPVVSETAPGQDSAAEVKLGERVTVEYETAGVARRVRVEAALSGAATGAVVNGQFSMLGQTVVVNVDGTAGPITQFGGGYAQASDVRAGDVLEVHGLLVRQGVDYQVQATRIERLAVPAAYLRITGIASELRLAGGPSFALGALTVHAAGATVLPASTALADGQTLSVLALPGTLLAGPFGTLTVQAAQIRNRELSDEGLDDSVSGSISQLNVQARSFKLGSLLVDYSSATVTPVSMTLSSGQYVRVLGRIGANGMLVASSLVIRDAGSESEGELRGNLSNYDAATSRFSLRGVIVDASVARVQGCPATGLVDGLYVEVKGSLTSTGVLARELHCEDEPSGASVEREGIAAAVDTAGSSFNLVPEKGAAIAVKWTSATYFGGLTATTLSGQKVQVEGSFVDGVLMARKIKVDD